jgi:uncharacterized protein (DUF2384 family)
MILQEYKRSPKNLTYAKVYNYALEMFQYNRDKTNHWWISRQKILGDKSPFELVKMGKGRKLVRLIQMCK